jgi:hypothetical protein
MALDVRDRALRNSGLLDLPPGYVLRNAIAWPWIKQVRTVWGNAIEFTHGNGRTEHVSLVSVCCGFAGSRLRLECPRCRQRVCRLYYLNMRLVCRKCEGLWYASQRTSSKGRKFLEASSVTMASTGRWMSHQNRVVCGGGLMLATVRRSPVSSGAYFSRGADIDA